MTLHRFFITDRLAPEGGVVPLSAADAHHLRDVLRLGAGDEIVAVTGGEAVRVRLTRVGDAVEGVPVERVAATSSYGVTLVQSLAKGEKMDAVVRQATELGVSRIVPLAAARSVVKLDPGRAAGRLERWRRIAAEAAKQSQRADVPTVAPLARIEDLPGVLEGSLTLVCWEDADDSPGIGEAIAAAGPDAATGVAVVVGPEGGFAADEVRALERAGALTVSLGATVLRTETAGVVACALAIHARGGLGGRRG